MSSSQIKQITPYRYAPYPAPTHAQRGEVTLDIVTIDSEPNTLGQHDHNVCHIAKSATAITQHLSVNMQQIRRRTLQPKIFKLRPVSTLHTELLTIGDIHEMECVEGRSESVSYRASPLSSHCLHFSRSAVLELLLAVSERAAGCVRVE